MNSNKSYWSSKTALTRRQLLHAGALGVTAVGLANVLACGGDGGEESDKSGLLYRPQESRPVKGGTYSLLIANEPQGFNYDSATGGSHAMHANSRLVKYHTFKYPDPVNESVVDPDAAASWEFADGGLTATYKLRPNFKFDPRPPTSGRAMTAEDVVFSWNWYEKLGALRTNLAQAANPNAPVISVTAVDRSTVQFKLAYPYAALNPMLCFYRHLAILPVEAVQGDPKPGQYDVRSGIRGTGAWRLKEYVPSVRVVHERNPDWYDADKVNFEQITYTLLPDYSTGLSQFRNGAIDSFTVAPEDILATKHDTPQLLLVVNEEYARDANAIRFSYRPGSPFFDERIRKAFSVLYDRDLYIDTFANVDRFRSAGLEVGVKWDSQIPPGYEGFWIDPQDEKAFGPSAKWFKYDVSEATKLMQAAGYGPGKPFETMFSYPTDRFGSEYNRQQEVKWQMWEEGGLFKLRVNNPVYFDDFRNNYHFNSNQHEGVCIGNAVAYPEVDGRLGATLLYGDNRAGHVVEPGKPDPQLESLIKQQRIELDQKKRIELVQDIQRHAASKMYVIFEAGSAQTFDLGWPKIGNWKVFRTNSGGVPSNETFPHLWLNQQA